jgi:hypothetical protein
MALTAVQLLSDQAFLFGDFPLETVTIPLDGTSYDCLVPRAEKRNDWEFGGLKQAPRATILIQRSTIATLPDQGDMVGFRLESWRVLSVRHDFAEAPVMIELESAHSALMPSDAPTLKTGAGDELLTGAGEPLMQG